MFMYKRFNLNPDGGSIQRTTISYKMDVDNLVVTTELKSVNFASAIQAKNIWMANASLLKKNGKELTTTAATTATTEAAAQDMRLPEVLVVNLNNQESGANE